MLVPYAAQAPVVQHAVHAEQEAGRLHCQVDVLTVDASQGREWPRVVICTVRTDSLGFFSEDARTLVAMSRARHAVRFVGDMQVWSHGTAAWQYIASQPQLR